MADSNIGALPLAPSVADDSLLVMEQQGSALKVTGAMIKEYAKQGVELEFQEYLDEAKAAADSAAGAVSAVTDMTVSAHTSETPTVTKSMREGKVNLDFGLPQGERGMPGPAGQEGPTGPQGPVGKGLTILGYYDTPEALEAGQTSPGAGDAYGVGVSAPYDIYVFDGVAGEWKNNGPLSDGGGVVPENAVTSEGGAMLEIPAVFGDAPHIITFTNEEELPLSASDVGYDDSDTGIGADTVQEAVDKLFTSVSDGKALVASAITDKGVPTAQDAAFQQMADNIGQISTGTDTQDATANPGDILGGKTAYTASGKVEGIIPSLPAQTIVPGAADKTVAGGQYLAGAQTIKGDPNLMSANIKKGVSLFGVEGALESSFAATLTVTADIGAVVTATCGDTSIEALSTTGTVVLELPIEGTWEITAVRGIAQYNTVTLEVSSQYSAVLTAEVHIEYFGVITPLNSVRRLLAAGSVGNYALFGGGNIDNTAGSSAVDAYDEELTHTTPQSLADFVHSISAASVGNYAIFGGGESSQIAKDGVTAYDKDLVKTIPNKFSTARKYCGAASIGNYALFGGGVRTYVSGGYPRSEVLASIEAYSSDLTKIDPPTPLIVPGNTIATANKSFAVFCHGDKVSAYDANLTRTVLSSPISPSKSARAGNYTIFVDAYGAAVTYDLFLTMTELNQTIGGGTRPSTTLMDFALFEASTYDAGYVGRVLICDPYLSLAEATGGSDAYMYPESAAASVGSYALFGGGKQTSANTNKVIAYKYK